MYNNNNNTLTRIGISEKVEFLKDRNNYWDKADEVTVVETHMSWVFITHEFVYKLKKPIQINAYDMTTLEARTVTCKEEVRLNRRLARDIYVGTTPLTVNDNGELQLGGKGKIVDWLVKMKRLPENEKLDYAIENKTIPNPRILKVAISLSEFYKKSPPAETNPDKHRKWLLDNIFKVRSTLKSKEYELSNDLVEYNSSQQLRFIEKNAAILDQRVLEGKIIEAHGDLKPEHIYLSENPSIIDCLEFKKELRILDSAEDMAFLAIGCEILGASDVGKFFIDFYKHFANDNIPENLLHFYKSKRACLRAKFAIAHTTETQYKHDPKWRKEANNFLLLAKKYATQI